jgi:hypothetical protein
VPTIAHRAFSRVRPRTPGFASLHANVISGPAGAAEHCPRLAAVDHLADVLRAIPEHEQEQREHDPAHHETEDDERGPPPDRPDQPQVQGRYGGDGQRHPNLTEALDGPQPPVEPERQRTAAQQR